MTLRQRYCLYAIRYICVGAGTNALWLWILMSGVGLPIQQAFPIGAAVNMQIAFLCDMRIFNAGKKKDD